MHTLYALPDVSERDYLLTRVHQTMFLNHVKLAYTRYEDNRLRTERRVIVQTQSLLPHANEVSSSSEIMSSPAGSSSYWPLALFSCTCPAAESFLGHPGLVPRRDMPLCVLYSTCSSFYLQVFHSITW